MRAAISLLLLLLLHSAAASAATVDQIVKLSKAGVSDAVILALVDRDKSIFSIEPEQLVKLQRDGVSEPVILAMLKSGRAEAEAAANAQAAMNAAWYLTTASAPQVLIVGGSETPTHADRPSWNDTAAEQYVVPYPVAVPVAIPRSRRVTTTTTTTATAAAPPATSTRGIFFTQPSTGIFFKPTVGEDLPPATAPSRRR